MKRTVVVLTLTVLTLLGLAPAVWAQTHPSQGANSEGRNEAGFGGGPHCHVLVAAGAQDQFDQIPVFPSHTAHERTGLSGGVFTADPDCDGLPG